jgi:predicted anti-sigma-YlaC factor YlaD
MNDHITPWLETYHDGELHGRQLDKVETHLAQCPECQQALNQLIALRALLQESPATPQLTSAQRFAAQVGLRLPRRPAEPSWKRTLRLGWQLAPAGLLGVWLFFQAAFIVTGIILLMERLGIGGDLLSTWVPTLGSDLLSMLSINLCLSVFLGILYLSWFASWLARQRHHNTENSFE